MKEKKKKFIKLMGKGLIKPSEYDKILNKEISDLSYFRTYDIEENKT